jgi:DNA-binding NarL/FixJ family response regulator
MRTYLIEPQLMFADYLQHFLAEAGLDVVATSHDIDSKDIAAHDPAAVFVDLYFFERGGPNALCRIRQATPSAALIAFCNSDDPMYAAACFISGADTVISKHSGTEGIMSSLRQTVAVPA